MNGPAGVERPAAKDRRRYPGVASDFAYSGAGGSCRGCRCLLFCRAFRRFRRRRRTMNNARRPYLSADARRRRLFVSNVDDAVSISAAIDESGAAAAVRMRPLSVANVRILTLRLADRLVAARNRKTKQNNRRKQMDSGRPSPDAIDSDTSGRVVFLHLPISPGSGADLSGFRVVSPLFPTLQLLAVKGQFNSFNAPRMALKLKPMGRPTKNKGR